MKNFNNTILSLFSVFLSLLLINFSSNSASNTNLFQNFGFEKTVDHQKIDASFDEISKLLLITKDLYYSLQSYRGLNNNILINARIIPRTMPLMKYKDKTVITNSFNGITNIEETFLEQADSQKISAIKLTYESVPEDICPILSYKLSNIFMKIEVSNENGNHVIYDTNKMNLTDSQDNAELFVSPEKIKESCHSKNNTLILTTL